VVLAGLAMTILPGPASVVIPTGLVMLAAASATMRAWLRRGLRRLRTTVAHREYKGDSPRSAGVPTKADDQIARAPDPWTGSDKDDGGRPPQSVNKGDAVLGPSGTARQRVETTAEPRPFRGLSLRKAAEASRQRRLSLHEGMISSSKPETEDTVERSSLEGE
jgi:hypothetical protein